MSGKSKNGVLGHAKKLHLSVVAPALSLMSAALSTLLLYYEHWRLAVVVLAGSVCVLLVAFNVYVACATDPAKTYLPKKEPLFSKRFRMTVHIISVVPLILSFGVAVCMSSARWSGYAFAKVKWCGPAIKSLRQHLEHAPEDYHAKYTLAICYRHAKRDKECVDTLKELLTPKDRKVQVLRSPVAYGVYWELAMAYARSKEYEKLVEILDDLLEMKDKEEYKNILGKPGDAARNDREYHVHKEIAFALIRHHDREWASGKYEKAREHIRKATVLNPTASAPYWMLGYLTTHEVVRESERSDGRPERVEAWFNKAKEAIENNAKLSADSFGYQMAMSQHHYWHGRALFELRDYDRCHKELLQGLRIVENRRGLWDSTEDFSFRLGLNELQRTGSVERTRQYWANLKSHYYKGMEQIALADQCLRMAIEAIAAGSQAAFSDYLQDAEDHLNEAQTSYDLTAKRPILRGLRMLEQKEYGDAARQFEKACSADPRNYHACFLLAIARLNAGQIVLAKESMTQAIQLKPEAALLHYWLGKILLKEGNIVAARAAFRRYIECDDANPRAYTRCTRCLLQLCDIEKEPTAKIAILEEVITTSERGLEILPPEEHGLARGDLLDYLHEAYSSLVHVHIDHRHFAQAEKRISEAVAKAEAQKHRSYGYHLDTQGWIIVLQTEDPNGPFSPEERPAKLSQAKQLFHRSLESLPADDNHARADVHFHLGYVEKLRGNTARARERFSECLRLDPSHPDAEEERDSL